MLKVAVIEADEIIALDIAKNIEHAELARADIFRTSEEALQSISTETYLLAIIDIGDDDQRAIDAARIIRRSIGIYCLIISDHTASKSLPKLKEAEPLGILAKPFSIQELISLIEAGIYRAEMERKLLESERKYRHLFQNSFSARCLVRDDGEILERNKKFESSFAPKDFFNIENLFSNPSDWNKMRDGVLRSETLQVELRTIDCGYGPRDIICNASLFQEEYERPRIMLEFIDVTDSKRIREELFQSQKQEEIGKLASGIAHDLNNFLTSIMGYLEILKLDASDDSGIFEDVRGIEKTIQKTSALTKQLLGFSRRKSFAADWIDLRETLADSLKMIRRLIPEHISLTLKEPGYPVMVYADASHVEQIALNLILNARDALEHVEQDPHITISLRIAKTRQKIGDSPLRAHIIVEDNGSGIPPHLIKRIFEPYFTTKEAGQGTGLGLSIVKSLVEMNNAQITAKSFEGKGTKFIVSFPNPKMGDGAELRDAIPKLALSNLEPTIHETLRGKSILIVEDDLSILEACSRVLERLGVVVTACVNAGEAILHAENTIFDLVLSDIVLPGASGIELWESLQKNQRAHACVFMTGYESNIPIAKWPNIDVLRKPFNPIVLLETCSAALRHSNP